MSRHPDPGPAYTSPAWFARRLDPHGVLGHQERDDAAEDLHRRHTAAIDAVGRHDVNPYELADNLIARARRQLAADHREPIPTAEPIDLDALCDANRTQGVGHTPDVTHEAGLFSVTHGSDPIS